MKLTLTEIAIILWNIMTHFSTDFKDKLKSLIKMWLDRKYSHAIQETEWKREQGDNDNGMSLFFQGPSRKSNYETS